MVQFLRFFWVFALISFGSQASFAQTLDRLYDNVQGTPHLEMINGAQSAIDIEIYQMKDSKIINALKAAIRRGVKVRIVQEPNPVSEPCHIFTPITPRDDAKCVEGKSFVAYVRSHHGKYVPFDKGLCGQGVGNCFQHGKVILVDSKLVLISTGNFNPSNLCDRDENPTVCNRDYTVVSRDPDVVRTIGQVLEADLAAQNIDIQGVLNAQKGVRVTVSPNSLEPLIAFIDSAKKTIQLQNQYLKNPDVNNALIRAAKRGVNVFLMVSSVCAFGRPSPTEADYWTKIYTTFDRAGIHTRIFNASIGIGGLAGYLHAKAILVDSNRAWVGSVNGSTMSLTKNREYGIFSNDAEFTRTLGTVLYSDYMHPDSESWQESLECKKDYIKPADSDGN